MAENVEHLIRERAYFLWEAEGRPDGRDHEHWLRAEAEVTAAAKAKPAKTAKRATKAKTGATSATKTARPKARTGGRAKRTPAAT